MDRSIMMAGYAAPAPRIVSARDKPVKYGLYRPSVGRQFCVLAGLALIWLPGCLVGPNYKPPAMRLPAHFGGANGTPRPAVAEGASLMAWWRELNDPVLDRLVDQALHSNLDMKIAIERVRAARAARAMQAAALYPTLGNSWTFTRQRYSENTPFGSFPQVFPPEYNLFYGGFDSSWEIDLFGGTRRGIEAAQAQLEAAVFNLYDARVSLLGEVARDYVTVRALERRIALARENTSAQQASTELTRARYQMGFAAALDVVQARSLLLETRAQVPALTTELNQTIHRLSVLVNKEPDALATELMRAGAIPGAADPEAIFLRIPPGLPSDLLRRRPDIRAAERQLAAATAQVGVATAAFFPSFSLTGNVGLESISLSNFLEGASRTWTVGPTLNLPIFEGGQLRANLAASNARQREAFYDYRKTVLEALREVEDALTAYANERELNSDLVATVAAYRRSADLAQDRYVGGMGSYLAVLEARRSLYDERDRLVQSDQRTMLDLVALYKALGGGWVPSAAERGVAEPVGGPAQALTSGNS